MTINCNGQLINLDDPKVMGIVNMTPDSFYDGGQLKSDKDLLLKTENMLKAGASFLDIGGYSSRPNADDIAEDEELSRVIPCIHLIRNNFPNTILSIDTFRSKVAKESCDSGVAIVNDISAGLLDKNMLPTVAALNVPYIMMHMRGNPQTMKSLTQYTDLLKEVIYYFSERISEAISHKINDIIIDPGFGFSKTIDQNYELLSKMELLNNLEKPIMVGVSRKSMVYKPLGSSAKEALNGTTVLHTLALQKGARILRVHDVKEAMETIKIFSLLD